MDAGCWLGLAYELGRNAKASERNERRAIVKQSQQRDTSLALLRIERSHYELSIHVVMCLYLQNPQRNIALVAAFQAHCNHFDNKNSIFYLIPNYLHCHTLYPVLPWLVREPGSQAVRRRRPPSCCVLRVCFFLCPVPVPCVVSVPLCPLSWRRAELRRPERGSVAVATATGRWSTRRRTDDQASCSAATRGAHTSRHDTHNKAPEGERRRRDTTAQRRGFGSLQRATDCMRKQNPPRSAFERTAITPDGHSHTQCNR